MADICEHLMNIQIPLNTKNFFDYVSVGFQKLKIAIAKFLFVITQLFA